MLMKDKDILSQGNSDNMSNELVNNKNLINKENMRKAWGDAFDYYFRGITENYLFFHGRATRLEFWGFMLASLIFFFPLYAIGSYVDVPLLAYYFSLVTLIPTFGVMVRRFHDINKKALLYIILGALTLVSAIFIKMYALILFGLWFIYIIYLLSKPTDINVGLFGEANESDEVYGEDNIKIIKKFRFMAIFLFFIAFTISYARFDDWSRQNAKRVGYESIMISIADKGRLQGYSSEQIKEVQKNVTEFIKENQNRNITDEEINKQVIDYFNNLSKLN